jgi:DNA polymerase-3 subunit epsilon
MTQGIEAFNVHETPIAVLDFETTGLTPGLDRVVEVSVYQLQPGRPPFRAFWENWGVGL